MACLELKHTSGVISAVPENTPYPADWKFTGKILWACNPHAADDLSSLVTKDGLMIGNIIKAITTKLGIKQCLKCKGRQYRYNQRGLEIQRKLKNAILRTRVS